MRRQIRIGRSGRHASSAAMKLFGVTAVLLSGCQNLSQSPAWNPFDQTAANLKPPVVSAAGADAKPSTSVQSSGRGSQTVPMSKTATIRGQSPEQWGSPTTGGFDESGLPLQPTDTLPQNRKSNPAAPTALASYPAQGGFAPQSGNGQQSGYGPQAGYGGGAYTGGTAYQPQGSGVLPPPTGQLGTGGAVLPAPQAPTPNFGYGAPGSFQNAPGPLSAPSDYGTTLAPGATGAPYAGPNSQLAPGSYPTFDPQTGFAAPSINQPRERVAPIDVYVQEARTGRIILGGSVNSDLGVAGQLIIDERNFSLTRLPTSWGDLFGGRAFRGDGQNFRAEFMPGSQVERYTVSWSDQNLLGYLPYSLSVGGFLYTRQFRDWTEQRLGGRIALGYEITKDIAISGELRMEDVKLFDPRLGGIQELDDALGSNDLYTARFRLARDTRDSPFMSTQGGLVELVFDQVFGEYDFSRGQVNLSRYFLVRERPDQGGRHTLATTLRFGVTGSQTPVFENYFAGGYSTLRGFSFRGASPKVGDVQVGGELMLTGSVEYVFPLTADEMLRGVAFVDYGTVEQDLTINAENFRVAPGLGIRVAVPALGPAPLAFDFAVPVAHADSDDTQVFSFFMGFTR